MKEQNGILESTSPSNKISWIDEMENTATVKSSPGKDENREELTNNQSYQLKIRKRELRSFTKLEADRQIKIDKLIRQEIKKQGKMNRKLSLDDDQTCFCMSQIYTMDGLHWKNRETSQLTTQKLDSIPIEEIKKIKLLNEHPMIGYSLFRVTVSQKKMRDFAIRTDQVGNWFANSLLICLTCAGQEPNMQRKSEEEEEVEGYILKKSQFLGNWKLRYVSISAKERLGSSKIKGEPATVKLKEVSELWSRLETIKYNEVNYLIIKGWHMRVKYEFGIPILDVVKWAKAFAGLVKQK